MEYPQDGNAVYSTVNIVPWTKQGTTFRIGGSFPIVAGTPPITLAASTNTVLGYGNGQMLAVASGVTSAPAASGLTAGSIVNFDPSSTDTGQQFWNGMIICDAGIVNFFEPLTGYAGTIQVATPAQGWVIRQQFLYGPGTPATDVALVKTALADFADYTNTNGAKGTISAGQVANSSGATGALEAIFGY